MRPELIIMLLQQGIELPNGGPNAHRAIVLQQHAMRNAQDRPSSSSAATAGQVCSISLLQGRGAAGLQAVNAGPLWNPATSSAEVCQSGTDVSSLEIINFSEGSWNPLNVGLQEDQPAVCRLTSCLQKWSRNSLMRSMRQ